MRQYSVLVVDDSAFMRRAISHMLEEDPQFYVIGIARNGVEAVEKVQRLKPDLVTMDVEMPKMNGLKALEQIMQTSPVSVVMLSSRTGEGAKETLHALELGAVDFFLKENLIRDQSGVDHTNEFLQRLKGIVEAKLPRVAVSSVHPQRKQVRKMNRQNTDLIFIGCSTGGPSALQTILPCFPADLPIPIVVAQHMPPGFTKPLAERFNTLCKLNVKEAENGQVVQEGTIYIAPSGYQTRFDKKNDGTVIFKVDNDVGVEALYKPSIDITLKSAAPIFTDRLLSVILTGMGVDGMQGCGLVKKYHGNVFVEAEDSCIVYGMPKAVLEAGYADGQYVLSQMYQEIMSFI
ncbi:Protein-glutamate methylesterase/protein-glutamine glutaminase [Neobacillus rhizosphaerae]|uniref:Protein-glutamate methylesterase/protein-glutamine glutaminase n=1 Tax=Neobacillus rhizosphaerae TaxID=2880965 RepID=A0ABM9ELB2_9BACI|nr:chemotaxis response regulator protein-glutamate methylesterase [Neobacillus rhizosphaerae]CAH2712933.1 Protein-glutamate methylesterase/protein-glutamine glutaminase [Neobacillus rhizosphaerae]